MPVIYIFFMNFCYFKNLSFTKEPFTYFVIIGYQSFLARKKVISPWPNKTNNKIKYEYSSEHSNMSWQEPHKTSIGGRVNLCLFAPWSYGSKMYQFHASDKPNR